MRRQAEEELMDSPQQVEAYAHADFEQAHQLFIDLLLDSFPQIQSAGEIKALDLGCGPCDISRRLLTVVPQAHIHGVDAGANMLSMAMRLNQAQAVTDKITLFQDYIHSMRLPHQHYDLIFSNSLLHHLKRPMDCWHAVEQFCARGGYYFVMDLIRPDKESIAHQLVEDYAQDEPDILKKDFYHSLLAAYTVDEVRQQLQSTTLSNFQLRQVTDRHFIVYGQNA